MSLLAISWELRNYAFISLVAYVAFVRYNKTVYQTHHGTNGWSNDIVLWERWPDGDTTSNGSTACERRVINGWRFGRFWQRHSTTSHWQPSKSYSPSCFLVLRSGRALFGIYYIIYSSHPLQRRRNAARSGVGWAEPLGFWIFWCFFEFQPLRTSWPQPNSVACLRGVFWCAQSLITVIHSVSCMTHVTVNDDRIDGYG